MNRNSLTITNKGLVGLFWIHWQEQFKVSWSTSPSSSHFIQWIPDSDPYFDVILQRVRKLHFTILSQWNTLRNFLMIQPLQCGWKLRIFCHWNITRNHLCHFRGSECWISGKIQAFKNWKQLSKLKFSIFEYFLCFHAVHVILLCLR